MDAPSRERLTPPDPSVPERGMSLRAGRWQWGTSGALSRGILVGAGALCWWSAFRLVLVPEAGALEGVVLATGWGLSLLPVHCTPSERSRR
ncbi:MULTISPECIES: hypothetical protein [unclassified Streptomyces]|uniref:hypothetical protein n=1 Tax=unclassified Streptomyces TaxID=2593676 RepID=UPI0019049A19|nr:hypothetical protein [Streptomyces sp. HSG2]